MNNNFWIDIKDRKPEYPGMYFVCEECHPMLFHYGVCWYDRDKGFGALPIVAWANIPEYEHKPEDRYE